MILAKGYCLMTAPIRASQFVQSIGVNAQLPQLNGAARSTATVNAMAFLGISEMRTTITSSMLQAGGVADRLAAAGVHFDVLFGGYRAIGDTLGLVSSFAAAHPGTLDALEGPNEINNWPINFGGLGGTAAGVAFVGAMGQAMNAGVLAGLALYDFTGGIRSAATMGDAASFANIHPYPQGGNQAYDWLKSAILAHAAPGKGMVITEAGYTCTIGAKGIEGVDELTQAKLTLNLLADATVLGVDKTYLYQLFDTGSAGTADSGFGLFNADGTAKPAATAIHNLTTILADKAAGADSFATHDLSYAIKGLPEGAHSLLIEKANGTYELMIWAEPDIWNEAADKAIAVTPQTVTVSLGGADAQLAVYDPLTSAGAVATASGNAISLTLTDHVMVVEISGLPTGATMAAAQYDAPMQLAGTAGVDSLVGGNGDDLLSGLAGNDTIDGGGGADRIVGGLGADVLWGGAGADTFVFRTVGESTPAASGRDTIMDFSFADGDRIDLSSIDANSRVAGNQAFVMGGNHFTGVAGQLIQTVADHQVLVQGDLNGDGRADFAFTLAHLDSPLAAGAFVL
jgi:Ca2+-binding RTX toxin-like protein